LTACSMSAAEMGASDDMDTNLCGKSRVGDLANGKRMRPEEGAVQSAISQRN
jgi:hypothetical protein